MPLPSTPPLPIPLAVFRVPWATFSGFCLSGLEERKAPPQAFPFVFARLRVLIRELASSRRQMAQSREDTAAVAGRRRGPAGAPLPGARRGPALRARVGWFRRTCAGRRTGRTHQRPALAFLLRPAWPQRVRAALPPAGCMPVLTPARRPGTIGSLATGSAPDQIPA